MSRVVDDDLEPEARRLGAYRRRVLVLGAGVLMILVVAELLLVLVLRSQGPPPRHPAGLVVLLVLLPVVCGGLLALSSRLALRRPEVRRVVVVADRRDVRRVRRLLTRGGQVAEADRATAQAVVDLNGRQSPRTQVWVLVASIVLFAVLAIAARRAITWVYLAVLVVAAPYALRSQRRLLATAAAQGIVPQGRAGRG